MVLLVLLAASCGDGDGAGPVEEESPVSGITISAVTVQYLGNPDAIPSKQAWYSLVRVSLTNVTGEAITLHHPAGCAVTVRLYTTPTDVMVYDEAVAACAVATPVAVVVPPGETRTLESATKPPWVITGDSLPADGYRFAGVLRLMGNNPIELDAGVHNLQLCEFPEAGEYFCSPHVPSGPRW
jgi:hypothetical protein